MSDAAGPGGARPGPVGDEVTRLVQAAQEWLRSAVGGHAAGAPPCRACPVCRLLAALTGEPSDLAERVGTVAGAFVDAVRVLFEPEQPDRAERSDQSDRSGPPAEPPSPPAASGARVEPIEIS